MVATWSNDDTSSDSHNSTSNQDSDDELCFMAFEDDHEEINSNSRSLSPQEWEEAYELLHKKCKKLKKKNKSLKKKITECVHDTSLSDELELFKKRLEEEREDKECILKSLDEIKLRVQQIDREI